MGNNGGRRSIEQITEDEMQKTYQYISGLAKSRRRVNRPDFNYYNIRLTNPRLLTLILTVCEHKKLHVPEFIESLLIQALRSRDKAFRHYFDNQDVTVDIQDMKTLVYGKMECGSDYSAPQLQRMNGRED